MRWSGCWRGCRCRRLRGTGTHGGSRRRRGGGGGGGLVGLVGGRVFAQPAHCRAAHLSGRGGVRRNLASDRGPRDVRATAGQDPAVGPAGPAGAAFVVGGGGGWAVWGA